VCSSTQSQLHSGTVCHCIYHHELIARAHHFLTASRISIPTIIVNCPSDISPLLDANEDDAGGGDSDGGSSGRSGSHASTIGDHETRDSDMDNGEVTSANEATGNSDPANDNISLSTMIAGMNLPSSSSTSAIESASLNYVNNDVPEGYHMLSNPLDDPVAFLKSVGYRNIPGWEGSVVEDESWEGTAEENAAKYLSILGLPSETVIDS